MSFPSTSFPGTSFPSTLPAAILDTILGRLALLILSGAAGDLTVARHAAAQMLAGYQPETLDELRLAAEIISFSLHALEALSQAADPNMPLTKVLRLRGGAVSLSRECHKAERRLDQLQKARHAAAQAQPPAIAAAQAQPPAIAAAQAQLPETDASPETNPARPKIDQAIALIEATRQATPTAPRYGGDTWTKSYHQRMNAKRIAENLKKNQAAHAAMNTVASATQATVPTPA